ncbi:MAG: amino acid permease, partial [Verrucomicrobiota bacterium]|nr:amino acid permease [Verrucomicrobiota bacterium]
MKPISSESYSAAVTRDDAHELASFGYTQQLRRTLGSFSSFAVAFSLISVITGVTANFGHGLQLVGGGVLASWLIVLCGQTLLALLLAELSNRMPLSGYGYQWTSRLMNPHYGFFVG